MLVRSTFSMYSSTARVKRSIKGTPTSLSMLYWVRHPTYRVGVLADDAATDRQHVRAVDVLGHRARLAGIDHEEELVVAALFPHLFDGVGCVSCATYPNRRR